MHRPEPYEISGRQWVVTIDPLLDHVVKRPLNPAADTTEKLFRRNSDAAVRMQEYYSAQGFGSVPVPRTELSADGTAVLQEKIVGPRLADFEDDEKLFALDVPTLMAIRRIIECSLSVRKKFGPFQDFIDLPGINDDLPVLQQLWRGLQARYSTNILIDETRGGVALVDPDFAMISTRHWWNTSAVIMTKPIMIAYMRRFYDQIGRHVTARI